MLLSLLFCFVPLRLFSKPRSLSISLFDCNLPYAGSWGNVTANHNKMSSGARVEKKTSLQDFLSWISRTPDICSLKQAKDRKIVQIAGYQS